MKACSRSRDEAKLSAAADAVSRTTSTTVGLHEGSRRSTSTPTASWAACSKRSEPHEPRPARLQPVSEVLRELHRSQVPRPAWPRLGCAGRLQPQRRRAVGALRAHPAAPTTSPRTCTSSRTSTGSSTISGPTSSTSNSAISPAAARRSRCARAKPGRREPSRKRRQRPRARRPGVLRGALGDGRRAARAHRHAVRARGRRAGARPTFRTSSSRRPSTDVLHAGRAPRQKSERPSARSGSSASDGCTG